MDKETLFALEEVVSYLWNDELESFEQWQEEGSHGTHIFQSIETLAKYAKENKKDIIKN